MSVDPNGNGPGLVAIITGGVAAAPVVGAGLVGTGAGIGLYKVPESRIDDNGRRAAVRVHEEAPGAREKGRMGEGSLLIRVNQNDAGMPGGGHRGDSGK